MRSLPSDFSMVTAGAASLEMCELRLDQGPALGSAFFTNPPPPPPPPNRSLSRKPPDLLASHKRAKGHRAWSNLRALHVRSDCDVTARQVTMRLGECAGLEDLRVYYPTSPLLQHAEMVSPVALAREEQPILDLLRLRRLHVTSTGSYDVCGLRTRAPRLEVLTWKAGFATKSVLIA